MEICNRPQVPRRDDRRLEMAMPIKSMHNCETLGPYINVLNVRCDELRPPDHFANGVYDRCSVQITSGNLLKH